MAPDRPREALASGSLRAHSATVTMGLGFFGVSTYVYLTAAARVVGPASFGDFALFWGLVYGLGLGVCFPLEQEMGRRVAEQGGHEAAARAVLRTGNRLAAVVVLVLAAVLVVVVNVAHDAAASDKAMLWGATVASLAALAVASVARGGLAGQHRFGAYSAQLLTEGAVRLVAGIVLAGVGVAALGPWMLIVAVGLLAAVLVTTGSSEGARSLPGPPLPQVVISMGALMVSAVISQSLLNFGPAAVKLLTAGEDTAAGQFLAASFIARLPVFAFAAVQVALLPHLVEAATRGDGDGFSGALRRVLLAATALGLAGVLGCASAGPQILALLGPGYALPRRDILLLAVSVALFVLTMVLQPAVVALRRAWTGAAWWTAAAVIFIGTCQLPVSPVLAVELALLAACSTAVLGLAVAAWRAVRTLGRLGEASTTDLP